MKKRITALFMALCVMLSLIPMNVFAETGDTNGSDYENETTDVIPVSGKKYIIVTTTDNSQYALTTKAGEGYQNPGDSEPQLNNFTGLEGRIFTPEMIITEDMVWEFETAEGGFYIKNGTSYLNATAIDNDTGGKDTELVLDNTMDIWVFSEKTLQSTNSAQYLTHSNGTASFVNTFSACSTGSALEFYDYAEVSEPEKCQHTFTDWKVKEAATCEMSGTDIRECTKCGLLELRTAVALGHDYSIDWSNDENTHWHECNRCGDESDIGNHNIDNDICKICGYKASHVHNVKHVNAKAATCTEDGNKEYYACTGCDTWFEDAAEEKEITNKSTVVIPAIGHDYSEYKSNNDATCAKEGTKTALCKKCNAKDTKTDEGSMLEHYYDSVWMNDTTGHWYVCIECGAKSEVASHEYVSSKCKICGFTSGHIHTIELVKAVAPTCTEAGNTAYYQCLECSKWFEDAEGTKVIADKTLVSVEAIGHSFTTYISNNDAACEKDGTKTSKCDRCDATDTKTEENTALVHSYGENRRCVHCGQKNPIKLDPEIMFYDETGTLTYTGAAIELSVDTVEVTENSGDITFRYYLDEACTIPTFAGQQKEGTAASRTGIYYVKATVEGNEDYNKATTEYPYILKIVPKKPTSLTATNMTSSIKLTWKKSAEADGYIISRRKNGTVSSAYQEIAVIDNNETLSYSDKYIKQGTRYFYTIRAYSYAEDGTRLLGNRLTTATQIVRMKVTSSKNYDGYVKIKWNSAPGAVKYEVLRKVSGKDDEYKRIKTITDGSTSYEDRASKSIVNGRRSYYKVVAIYDTEAVVQGESYGKTNVYLNRGKISSITAAKKAFTVKWNKNSSAEGYEIMYSTSSSFDDYETVYISSKNTTSKKISGLKAGKKYYVKVRSYKTYNDKEYPSAWSGYRSVTTKK